MLFRKSISNTKKFFQKTLQSFKSFLSGGYEKLPKHPPFNPFSCTGGSLNVNTYTSYQDLDVFYTDFTHRWDADREEAKKRSKKEIMEQEKEAHNGSFMKFVKASPAKNNIQMERSEDYYRKMKIVDEAGKREEEYHSCSTTRSTREGRACLVAQKLKELERFDVSNVEHVLDIEEALHYYSRLTCPAYLEIVDKFFMDMCSEFFSLQASTLGNNSRLIRPRSMKL